MNIFLIGYRCSGKTTVGRALAVRLQRPFIDADTRLVEINGESISQMVIAKGWAYFRRRESDVINKLCGLDQHVIATGGGVVLDPVNVTAMKSSGKLVWLKVSPETIRKRIFKDKRSCEQRPPLTSRGVHDEIEATLSERMPFYETAMDFSVHTDGRTVDDICELIISRVKNIE